MDEMVEITGLLPDASPECLARLDRAMATVASPEPGDFDALIAKRDALLALA
jgi:beta-N-acetylhexosaminidase